MNVGESFIPKIHNNEADRHRQERYPRELEFRAKFLLNVEELNI